MFTVKNPNKLPVKISKNIPSMFYIRRKPQPKIKHVKYNNKVLGIIVDDKIIPTWDAVYVKIVTFSSSNKDRYELVKMKIDHDKKEKARMSRNDKIGMIIITTVIMLPITLMTIPLFL